MHARVDHDRFAGNVAGRLQQPDHRASDAIGGGSALKRDLLCKFLEKRPCALFPKPVAPPAGWDRAGTNGVDPYLWRQAPG